MLSHEIRNTARYFADRSNAVLMLHPMATAGIAQVLERYAEQAERLEAETGRDGRPEVIINLAELRLEGAVRCGVAPTPKDGGGVA